MKYVIKGKIIFENSVLSPERARNLQFKIEQFILKIGFEENEIVGIMLDRSPIMVITLFALLDIGQPFLCIDNNAPQKRIIEMMRKANVKKIISDKKIFLDEIDFEYISIAECLEERMLENTIQREFTLERLAYVLFTSGTTGTPKGVEISHKNFWSFVKGVSQRIPTVEGDTIVSFSNYTFDIFLLESIYSLLIGMNLVLANEAQCKNPRMMRMLLKSNQINVLQITPSRLIMLQSIDPYFESLKKIKILMVGGEKFPLGLLRDLQNNKKIKIFNMYGPTETTIWSSISDLTRKDSVDIGTPICGTEIYIYDGEHFITNNQIGEICIAGAGVGNGYINDNYLTNMYFRKCKEIDNSLVYFTGDMGYRTEEGRFVCLGRKDSQVKLFGHRVELEDIDSNIMKVLEIDLAVTCFSEKTKRLLVFYTCKHKINENNVVNKLKKFLPLYMIPQEWIRVDNIKYTISGKSDRNGMLNEYEKTCKNCHEEVSCSDKDVEKKLLHCIKKYSVINEIKDMTKIEKLRISSIDYVKMIIDLENIFAIDFEDKYLVGENVMYVSDLKRYIVKKIKTCGENVK